MKDSICLTRVGYLAEPSKKAWLKYHVLLKLSLQKYLIEVHAVGFIPKPTRVLHFSLPITAEKCDGQEKNSHSVRYDGQQQKDISSLHLASEANHISSSKSLQLMCSQNIMTSTQSSLALQCQSLEALLGVL